MASNRHLGRIVALQTLYEYEFRREVGDDTVEWLPNGQLSRSRELTGQFCG